MTNQMSKNKNAPDREHFLLQRFKRKERLVNLLC